MLCENGLLQYEDEAEDGLEIKIGDEMHIEFTYTVTIKESDQLWATRLDHYLNYGDPKLQWEQLAVALAVFALVSFTFFVVLCSAVNRDDQTLHTLRATYRQRWRDRRSRATGFSPVG